MYKNCSKREKKKIEGKSISADMYNTTENFLYSEFYLINS